jgi:hypothetical protein
MANVINRTYVHLFSTEVQHVCNNSHKPADTTISRSHSTVVCPDSWRLGVKSAMLGLLCWCSASQPRTFHRVQGETHFPKDLNRTNVNQNFFNSQLHRELLATMKAVAVDCTNVVDSVCALSPCAIRRCIARVDVCRYVLPQSAHSYGFVCVWTTWCLYRLEYSVKRLPQPSHVQT